MNGYAVASTAKVAGGIVGSKQRRKKYIEERPMKKTLKQRFREWLYDDQANVALVAEDYESVELESRRAVRFTIHQANGGRVVQTRRYDDQKDRNIENLYVITNDMEFGREIDKIITMEALR
jgi:hypothetical protein